MSYATDLSDSQFAVCQKIIPDQRKRKYPIRDIVNAIFYILHTGCQWRLLPNDFPPYASVHYYFRKRTKDATIQHLRDRLTEMERLRAGKQAEPTAAIIESQSVKTTAQSSRHSGFDAGKKIKGRKRHILVDTLGLIICCVVHSAAMQDRDGAKLLLKGGKGPVVPYRPGGQRLLVQSPDRLGEGAAWPGIIYREENEQSLCGGASALAGGAHLCLDQPGSAP